MGFRTPLFDQHTADEARIVDFAGWDMPIQYASQIEEHHAVRQSAGMFDVSHMGVVDISGGRATEFMRYLLANDVSRLAADGRALYTCLLNHDGGILDDLIVYRVTESHYRTVVNAATRDKDVAWIRQHAAAFDVSVDLREDLAMVAVQGPQARELAHGCLPGGLADAAAELKPFAAAAQGDWFLGRTGYTGEDGYEVILPAGEAAEFWECLRRSGVSAAGLGARDTLRLEAGLNLYGQDMDEQTTPLECGLGWTVAMEPADREFIGREALAQQQSRGVGVRFVGLVLEGRGVLRPHQAVSDGSNDGELTSGSYSPTLGRSIGMARVPEGFNEPAAVHMRGREMPVRIVQPPFVRQGKARIEL
jgi:aminomethyltransferase